MKSIVEAIHDEEGDRCDMRQHVIRKVTVPLVRRTVVGGQARLWRVAGSVPGGETTVQGRLPRMDPFRIWQVQKKTCVGNGEQLGGGWKLGLEILSVKIRRKTPRGRAGHHHISGIQHPLLRQPVLDKRIEHALATVVYRALGCFDGLSPLRRVRRAIAVFYEDGSPVLERVSSFIVQHPVETLRWVVGRVRAGRRLRTPLLTTAKPTLRATVATLVAHAPASPLEMHLELLGIGADTGTDVVARCGPIEAERPLALGRLGEQPERPVGGVSSGEKGHQTAEQGRRRPRHRDDGRALRVGAPASFDSSRGWK